ncbi:hypothetical protein PINS_up002624 [Pythium insidiosum]|nr:hypothetical protein PINS_up002624 [Pythium insidiosum]
MAKRRSYSVGVAWHMGAHLSGVLILALSYVSADRVVSALRWLLFAYFLLASLDVVLSRYHQWRFVPLTPQPKRFALVTGATAGLGRELAYALAEKKFSLVLAARTAPLLERMRAEIELVHKPVEVELCVCDLSTPSGVDTLVEFLREKNLVVDVLVNAATDSGDGEQHPSFVDMPTDRLEEMLRVNLTAMTRLTHAVVPQMIKRGIGFVLNLSSVGAVAAAPTAAAFTATKAFVSSFSQALQYELRATGVNVTAFHVGALEVNLNDPSERKKELAVGEMGPWVVHPKDCAQFALDALFNAQDVAYDSYLNQLWAFLLRAFIPTRVGHAIIAISWRPLREALSMLKR